MRSLAALEMRLFFLWSRVAVFVGGWGPASPCGTYGPKGPVGFTLDCAARPAGSPVWRGSEEHFGGFYGWDEGPRVQALTEASWMSRVQASTEGRWRPFLNLSTHSYVTSQYVYKINFCNRMHSLSLFLFISRTRLALQAVYCITVLSTMYEHCTRCTLPYVFTAIRLSGVPPRKHPTFSGRSPRLLRTGIG